MNVSDSDRDTFFSSAHRFDSNVLQFSKEKKSVCWYCAKMLDLFLMRSNVITFLSGQSDGTLRMLQKLPNRLWSKTDFDFLVELYKTGPQRQ
mmetsp:Transcript_41183/g.54094  ORF Transcript_41183/g.54094 Transcript_41183/m.54094 type:complete len:92 (-) Transcript_41183:1226-1501(-)